MIYWWRLGQIEMDLNIELAIRTVGRKILCHESLSSTMDEARKEAQKGADEGTVIIAQKQTSARGRMGREWISPEGNIALSVVLYPESRFLPHMIMVASVAVVRAIKDVTGLKAEIKWPNDIMLNGRKVCGILTESSENKQKKRYVVIGIGINVSLRSKNYPEIAEIATGLESELGKDISIKELLKKLIKELDGLYSLLPDGKAIYKQWRDAMKMLGRRVRVTCGEEEIEGIARDVLQDGSLLLECEDGQTKKVLVGDVCLCKL